MPILLDNLSWMFLNSFLAFLGFFFSFFLNTKTSLFRVVFLILWILFIPNTIYILTDIQYYPEQFLQLDIFNKILLSLQYFVLLSVGLITYYRGFYPFEKLLLKSQIKTLTFLIIVAFNYLIAFAVLLGKLERIHSWYIFTTPQRVISSGLSLLSSSEMVVVILILGSTFNALYFLLRRKFSFK